jgi:hypothetical protein
MADAATERGLESLIEERRQAALNAFEDAAQQLRHSIEHLRWAPTEAAALDLLLGVFAEVTNAGLASYREMLGIQRDLDAIRAAPEPRPILAATTDKNGRLDVLRDTLVSTAEVAQADLGAFAAVLRDGAAQPAEILRLAQAVNAHHEQLRTTFNEAVEVASCTGSA